VELHPHQFQRAQRPAGLVPLGRRRVAKLELLPHCPKAPPLRRACSRFPGQHVQQVRRLLPSQVEGRHRVERVEGEPRRRQGLQGERLSQCQEAGSAARQQLPQGLAGAEHVLQRWKLIARRGQHHPHEQLDDPLALGATGGEGWAGEEGVEHPRALLRGEQRETS
jgi:hypothetical protein